MSGRELASRLLEHLGIEPASEAARAEVALLRLRLEAMTAGEQPAPRPASGRPVWEMVIEDMHARDRVGRQRYGVPLQAGNGRDALRDAYDEALDLAVYLRQAIEEGR